MLGKLQTPRLRPMWAPEPGAAALAALGPKVQPVGTCLWFQKAGV